MSAPSSHQPSTTSAPAPFWAWLLVMVGGLGGVVTASVQMWERIQWAAAPEQALFCDLSARLSCSSVFSHWQSSALGIPNSIIGLPVFAMLAMAGIAGVLGTRPSRRFLGWTLFLGLFMLGFVTWYLFQTAFAIGILCLWCAGCGVFSLTTMAGLGRIVAAEGLFGASVVGRAVRAAADGGSDLLLWTGWAAVIAAALWAGVFAG